MEDYQIRVIQEFLDLVEKRKKLRIFLYSLNNTLRAFERMLLEEQDKAMSAYGRILAMRIEQWRTDWQPDASSYKIEVLIVETTTK